MKIIEKEITREIAASPSVVLWNYWDQEHLYVIHKNYTAAQIIYEDDRTAIYLLTYKLPVFTFLTSRSLNIMVQKDENTIKVYNVGIFGVPSSTTIHVDEIRKDYTKITMTYKFMLTGWKKIMGLLLPYMIEKWNEQVWLEDLPLKIRRQKVLRLGFTDFIGLPKEIEKRIFEGDIPFKLPITRHKDSPVNLPF